MYLCCKAPSAPSGPAQFVAALLREIGADYKRRMAAVTPPSHAAKLAR